MSFDEEEDQLSDEAAFMKAYTLTGQAKVKGGTDFIDTLLEAGAKFLLFVHHKDVMNQY